VVTRIFEMKKQYDKDDEAWILAPYAGDNEEGLLPDERRIDDTEELTGSEATEGAESTTQQGSEEKV